MRTQLIILFLLLISGCSVNSPVTGSTEYLILDGSDESLIVKNRLLYKDSLLFTGKLIDLYDNNDTARMSEYVLGKLSGKQLIFYIGGMLSEERYYENGKKEGQHRGWWASGKQKFIYHFKNDEFEGNFKMWNESGMLFNDFNYSGGHEEGLQRSWFPDGSIQSNYVAKNNRKYGLTGVKNCRSVKDEIDN